MKKITILLTALMLVSVGLCGCVEENKELDDRIANAKLYYSGLEDREWLCGDSDIVYRLVDGYEQRYTVRDGEHYYYPTTPYQITETNLLIRRYDDGTTYCNFWFSDGNNTVTLEDAYTKHTEVWTWTGWEGEH